MGNKNSQGLFPPADYLTKKYAKKKQDQHIYNESESSKVHTSRTALLQLTSNIVSTMMATGASCDFSIFMVEDEKNWVTKDEAFDRQDFIEDQLYHLKNMDDFYRINDAKTMKKISSGAYGIVYETTNQLGKKVALKFAKEFITEMLGSVKEAYLRESVIMGRLSHPNVIKYLDQFKSRRQQLIIVMEYANGGSLQQKMESKKELFTPNEVRSIITQILLGLHYIHRQDIVHRDIKPQNILVERLENSSLILYKLADFGISKLVGKKFLMTVNESFTPQYSSIEQLKMEPASPAFDIWSAGMIFYELINGVRPYEINSRYVDVKEVFKNERKELMTDDKEAIKMVNLMLEKDQSKRPSALELLRMPYFSKEIDNYVSQFSDYTNTLVKKNPVLGYEFSQYLGTLKSLQSFIDERMPVKYHICSSSKDFLAQAEVTAQVIESKYVENEKYNGIIFTGYKKPSDEFGQISIGFGRIIMPDGTKYEGEIIKNLATGIGRCWYPDGSMYEGFFENNKRNRRGVFVFPSGKDRYEGDFEDNLRHGEGEMRYEDGTIYNGPWENDRPSSKYGERGLEIYPNGDQYEGTFKEDLSYIMGHYTYKSGDVVGIKP